MKDHTGNSQMLGKQAALGKEMQPEKTREMFS
jgi:hypothetical protein